MRGDARRIQLLAKEGNGYRRFRNDTCRHGRDRFRQRRLRACCPLRGIEQGDRLVDKFFTSHQPVQRVFVLSVVLIGFIGAVVIAVLVT